MKRLDHGYPILLLSSTVRSTASIKWCETCLCCRLHLDQQLNREENPSVVSYIINISLARCNCAPPPFKKDSSILIFFVMAGQGSNFQSYPSQFGMFSHWSNNFATRFGYLWILNEGTCFVFEYLLFHWVHMRMRKTFPTQVLQYQHLNLVTALWCDLDNYFQKKLRLYFYYFAVKPH